MGYYIDVQDYHFNLKADSKEKEKALKTLKRAGKNGFDWVRGEELAKAKTLEEALYICNWVVDEPDVIFFEGEKLGSEKQIFSSIANAVEDGSYIVFHGEDGEVWKWVFTDGQLEEYIPEYTWVYNGIV